MMWRVFKAFHLPWQALEDTAQNLTGVSREEPEEILPGSDLSERERRAAMEREAQRRSERNAR
jgi:hypothetical protein